MSPTGHHVKALGLILSFRDTDIEQLAEENVQVRNCLEAIGFEVQVIEFESCRYKQSLAAFLNVKKKPGPRLIYINGHGSETEAGELELSGQDDGKTIPWRTLLDLIGSAECQALTILDCCNAGLAAVSNLKREHIKNLHSKELITAGAWGITSADRLAPALCQALQSWCNIPQSRQATSLHRALLTIIKRMRDDAIREKRQALCVIQDHHRRSMDTLTRLMRRVENIETKIEKEKTKTGLSVKDLSASCKQLQKLAKDRDSAWEDVAKEEERSKEFKGAKKELERQLEKIKDRHPQPIYTKLNSRAEPWTLKGGFYGTGSGAGRGKNRRGSVGSEY